MEKTKQARSAGTVTAKKPREAMAVIIRNVPPTYNWGWFSREDPRMHLQTVDREHRELHYKVWLEKQGRRVFEPEPGMPAKVLKALEKVVAKERKRVDAEWASFMIKKGWLRTRLADGIITIIAYPGTPSHFERTIAVRELIGNESFAEKLRLSDIALNAEFACLEIYPQLREGQRMHEPLERILWEG